MDELLAGLIRTVIGKFNITRVLMKADIFVFRLYLVVRQLERAERMKKVSYFLYCFHEICIYIVVLF